MALNAPNHPILPAELVDLVIENLILDDSEQTLKRCALALRSARPLIRRFLFANIVLQIPSKDPAAGKPKRAKISTASQRFLEVLLASPHLGGYVRELSVMSGDFDLQQPHVAKDAETHIPGVLQRLRGLESLTIELKGHGHLHLPETLVMALELPSATVLHLDGITLPLASIGKLSSLRCLSSTFTNLACDPGQPLAIGPAPRLERLSVLRGFFSDATIFAAPPSYFDHLVRLEVRGDFVKLDRLLRLCEGTLTHLEMNAPRPENSSERLDLSMLASLRHLVIHEIYIFPEVWIWLRSTLGTVDARHVELRLGMLETWTEDTYDVPFNVNEYIKPQEREFARLDEVLSEIASCLDTVHLEISSDYTLVETAHDYIMYQCDEAADTVLSYLPRTGERTPLFIKVDGVSFDAESSESDSD